ncbi:MAG: pentapeptide repeat-containing protein [Cyanobacteria bacterium P01_D01_bin.115]
MVNEEQVALLKQGAEAWNQWRKDNPDAAIDLIGTDLIDVTLSGADLFGTNLRDANLSDANLYEANLREANLREANLVGADLRNADLGGVILNDANLFRANLSGANLSGANLSGANLMATDLSGANLFKANLRCSQVLNAYFKRVTLTGACIGDWQIGSNTNLEDVKCDYIFRTYDGRMKFTGRLPVDPDSTFAPGEFEQWIQVRKGALDTIDITFTEGIDWQAFFTSLEAVRQQHPDANVAMKSVEEDGGIFVARLKVETEVGGEALRALEASIEKDLKAFYEKRLAAAHGKIEGLQWSLEQTLKRGSNPISQTFQGPVGNVAGTNQGKMQNIQHNYASERQSLSGAAKEIRDLLDTLSETYNTTTDTGQGLLMKQFDQEVEKHPKWRRALKEGGVELMKLLFPPISIPWEMAMVYLEEEA